MEDREGALCYWHIRRCVSSQTFSVSGAEKNMCLGFQQETTTKNPFRFFQLESGARSCSFRESEVWIYMHV